MYQCQVCGQWVNGNTHNCSPYNSPYPLISITYSPRCYKCPCGGEFNYPVSKNGKYYCPFCNKIMEGC